jgi:glycosyltransferase involved in cell wall biosynthesis
MNWIGYYMDYDGYGRFSSRMVRALQTAGVPVTAQTRDVVDAPAWLCEQWGLDWDSLTISCMPPFMLRRMPGRHWLYSMTEGSIIPPDWVEAIHNSGVERVLVPCQHNKAAFERSGVEVPVDVLLGGTDPAEFPVIDRPREGQPYTFLALADRGWRKGWNEAWEAFYLAFGGKTSGDQDVRLIIKALPTGGNVVEVMAASQGLDPRIVYQIKKSDDMATVYAQADCVVMPSRSEGWGMPHREAAMMGIPVIVQRYSGLDDGHTEQWASVVEGGVMQPIPLEETTSLGEWRVADVRELAALMRRHYEQPYLYAAQGRKAAAWLRANQTWQHAATQLIDLMRLHGVFAERMTEYAIWTR